MTTAICSGSFDPITVGHLDLVERAAKLFDRVILCVVVNGEKKPRYTTEERLAMAQAALRRIPNADAEAWDGLLVDFAKKNNAQALIRGVRGTMDMDWEYQLAQINRDLCPELDTVFLPARPEYIHVSSTLAREMVRCHQDLAAYVPAGAVEILQKIEEGKVIDYGK